MWTTVKRAKQEDKLLHLTEIEKLVEEVRAFFFMEPEEYIKELIKEKEANNELVEQALEFLKRHSDIQRYVFPTGKLVDINVDRELEKIFVHASVDLLRNGIVITR